MKNIFNKSKTLFESFLRTPINNLTGFRKKFFRFIKVLIISLHAFFKDRCILRASALTFYSLMSIVPVIAMSFAIAKGFGYQAILEQELKERFLEYKNIINQVIIFSINLLENTKGGLIASVGFILLFWSIIKVLNNIESAMNDIWGIRKQRSVRRKFTDYFTMMLIGPFVFLAASSVTVFIVSRFEAYITNLPLHDTIASPILFFIRLTPYCLIWALFTFIYFFMPNTKVNLSSAIVGGVIGGTVYQITQRLYLIFQIGAARYGAIYGSFAALPLFLIWMQLSWIIVLAGAEISFAWQNFEIYEFGYQEKPLSNRLKTIISLWVTCICVKKFIKHDRSITIKEIHKKTKIPIHCLYMIIKLLVDCNILSEVVHPRKDILCYQPAKSVMSLCVKDVVEKLNNVGLNEIPSLNKGLGFQFKKVLDSFSKTIASSEDNRLFKDIEENTKI
jgi:membrane protein